jgi:multisubunit Na+/H+ antiporter MnhB subunit
MTMVPVMWSIWGFLVLILAGVWLYRSRLERDEEDQIFIDDAFNHQKNAQAAIVEKVNKVQPIMRVMLVVTGLATLFVIGYYVLDIVSQFK